MPCSANQAHGAVPEPDGGDGLFVVVDLGVDEPGAVVDRGVDVAVADLLESFVVVVAASVEPPAATVGDATDLLHVDVDQLAWAFTLVAAHRLGVRWRGHRDRGDHSRQRSRWPAPSTPPGRSHGRCDRRPSDAGGVAAAPCWRAWLWSGCGDRCGRELRSNSPASPSATNRSRHLRTVLASTWNRSAVASIVQCCSSTQATIRRRPSGVNRRVRVLGSSVET